MTSYASSASDIHVFYPHVILTSEGRHINFIVDFGFRIQKYSHAPNLSKLKSISWQICKFLHFSIPRHIHNPRLPLQLLRLMRIVIMCKMTPIGVRLNLKNFIFGILCCLGVIKESLPGGGIRPPR